jgi:hypothetical protein
METTQQKIQEAITNTNEWIVFLATKSEKDLERRLGINQLQFAEACKNKQEDVCELLELMRRIIIETGIYKDEHNIADAPNEIELAITENKREAKQYAERYKLIESEPTITENEEEDIQSSFKVHKARIKEEDDNQMSLF